jgi:uncharacterized membrane protein YdjX (TVP38/TMEM64 family)
MGREWHRKPSQLMPSTLDTGRTHPSAVRVSSRSERVIGAGKLAILAGALLALALAMRFVDIAAWLQPQWIVGFLNSSGALAPLVFMGMMATAVIASPIPSWPLDVAAGLAFGPWLGTLYAAVGAEIGALVSFFIARALGREAIERLVNPDKFLCPDCTTQTLGRLVFVMRLIPGFSFDLVSYAAGLTAIPVRTFAVATFLGTLPPTFLLVYAGREVIMASSTGRVVAGVVMACLLFSPLIVRWLGGREEAVASRQGDHEPQCRGCGRRFPVSKLRLSPAWAGLVTVLVCIFVGALVL